MNNEQVVIVGEANGVCTITLNRPDKFNCLSSEIVDGLNRAFDSLESSSAVRAVLIRGLGKHFCTGADLEQVLEARESRDDLKRFIDNGHRVLERMERARVPIVAAVHGLCLAGGLELAMACDVVFASRSAKLGCQHARYGLVPGWGGTQRLTRLVGLRRALDLMFSARWLSSEEALEWQLVNHVVDDDLLLSAAESYCNELASRSADGLSIMKSLARNGLEGSLQAGLELERRTVVDALLGSDVNEGLIAFQEGRDPVFAKA